MTNAAQTESDEKLEQMHTAFSLVDPTCERLGRDWKDEIYTYGSEDVMLKTMADMGVTLADVLNSITFFTAAKPRVNVISGVMHIVADGYRKGPAGDH